MIKLILILTLISNIAFAQSAQFISKGTPAPFDGDLLTTDQVKSLYNDSLEKTSLQKQLDLTNQNNQLLQQEKTILLDQNIKLIQANASDHSLSNWEKVGYFTAGVVITGLAIKGAMSLRP